MTELDKIFILNVIGSYIIVMFIMGEYYLHIKKKKTTTCIRQDL